MTQLEDNKFFFKTNVGDTYSTRVETIQNELLYTTMTESPITGLKYVLEQKGDLVEVTLSVEFEDPDQGIVLGMAGNVFIECVKKYAEYLEGGGNPEEYNKKKK